MSLIIPYDDKLDISDGAFINSNNEIIFTYGAHERFSANYCQGRDYNYLISKNFEGENIDPFRTSKLTKEQLVLFKLWLEKNAFYHRKLYSDFMVFILGFDKIETIMRRGITTTSDSPHTRFYNYYLMDWHVNILPPMRYNEETGLFEHYEPKNWIIKFNEDRNVESEISEIKQNVLKRDRHHFFK